MDAFPAERDAQPDGLHAELERRGANPGEIVVNPDEKDAQLDEKDAQLERMGGYLDEKDAQLERRGGYLDEKMMNASVVGACPIGGEWAGLCRLPAKILNLP